MRSKSRAAWIVLVVLIAVGWSLAGRWRPSAPTGDPMPLRLSLPASQEVQLAVYFTAGNAGTPSIDALLAAARSWVASHAKEPLRASIERQMKEGGLELEVLERDGLPLPFDSVFDSLPDPTRGRKRFAEAGHAVLVQSKGALAPPCAALWAAWGAARGIAEFTGGLIYDPSTFRFAQDGSSTADLPADGGIVITDHIVVPYSSGEDGLSWVTTTGLGKFGLPNLECRGVPPHVTVSIAEVLNTLAHQLVARVLERPAAEERDLVLEDEFTIEGAVFVAANRRVGKRRGATGAALVRIAYTSSEETEPFLTLLPPRGSSAEKGVWLHSVVAALEPREDPVVRPPENDPALAGARKEARSRLPAVKRRFLAGLAPGEALYVKHAFTEDEVVEHMWVAVTSWDGQMVEGTLANDPQDIRTLRGGQAVEIDEAAVDDWLLRRADGTREGGFSAKVLEGDAEDG